LQKAVNVALAGAYGFFGRLHRLKFKEILSFELSKKRVITYFCYVKPHFSGILAVIYGLFGALPPQNPQS